MTGVLAFTMVAGPLMGGTLGYHLGRALVRSLVPRWPVEPDPEPEEREDVIQQRPGRTYTVNTSRGSLSPNVASLFGGAALGFPTGSDPRQRRSTAEYQQALQRAMMNMAKRGQ